MQISAAINQELPSQDPLCENLKGARNPDKDSSSSKKAIELDEHAKTLLYEINHLGKVMETIGVNYRLGGIINFLLYKSAVNPQSDIKLYRQHTDLDIIIKYEDAKSFFENAKMAGYEICTYEFLAKNQYKLIPITFDEYEKNNTSFIVMAPKESINASECKSNVYDLFINKSDKDGNEIIYRDVTLDKKYIDENIIFTTMDGHKIPLSHQLDVILYKLKNCRVKDIQDIHRIIQNDYGLNVENINISLGLINKALDYLFSDIFDDLKSGLTYDNLLSKYKQEDNKLFHGKMYGTPTMEYILQRVVRVFDNTIDKADYIQKAKDLFYESQVGKMINSVSY